ncbi:MAG TPA: hypothetical protein VE890_11295, partial [Thermoguttaceae bacterium]|nr:hypothetical protein [Thermoguttaceae bacterium]
RQADQIASVCRDVLRSRGNSIQQPSDTPPPQNPEEETPSPTASGVEPTPVPIEFAEATLHDLVETQQQ